MKPERSAKRRHHVVPRFYLRAFASDERRVHIYNLPRMRSIPNVSLRDQCYRHRFYGPSDELENQFARFEAAAAPVFNALRNRAVRARVGSARHKALTAFVALQLQRTEAAVARVRAMMAAAGAAAFQGPVPRAFNLEEDEALAILVQTLPEIDRFLDDLKVLVIHAPSGLRFITSDHPVVKFNHYCAGIFEVGVLGADCRGLEIALPISPQAALILYDGDVYRAKDRGSGRAEVIAEDVLVLNRLQAIGARENLYFSHWGDAGRIAPLVASIEQRQQVHLAIAEEAEAPDHGILAINEVLPDVPMELSCLDVRRGAARTPWPERVHRFRHAVHMKAAPPQGSGVRRFEVREHRYIPLQPAAGSRLASGDKAASGRGA